MADSGKLIALESADESLVERLTLRLYRWLGTRSVRCEHTAAPTFGPVGAQLILHRAGRLHLDPLSLPLVELADRLDHLGRPDGILAWLSDGRQVLCRHYLLASLARHLPCADLDWLLQINVPCRRPDLILYLDTGPEHETQPYRSVIEGLRERGWSGIVIERLDDDEHLFVRCRAHLAHLLDLEV